MAPDTTGAGQMLLRFAQHNQFTNPRYEVIRDFGKLGFESVTDPEATKSSIIDDIATGQIDRVVSVTEIFEDRARDITDDIKEAVLALIAQREAA